MKYLAFYDLEEYKNENRCVTPSTQKLVRYMADVMSDEDAIEIISPTRTLNKKGIYKGRVCQVDNKITLRHPPTFGAKTCVGRILAKGYVQMWLFIFLLIHLKNEELIVIYHGLSYIFTIKCMKKIKKIRLIMEVREIYANVNPSESKYKRKRELKYLSYADAYIVPSEFLNKEINTKNKPYVVAAGIYESVENITPKWNDGKIHVVYAGTLDPNKAGAQNLLEVTRYLTEKYHVHILGFGTELEIKSIKEKIDEIKQSTEAEVTYDGVLHGKQFEQFLHKCDIGVALQDINGKFNNTSFPSKILTYLANGLEVVSSDIPVVKESAVGKFIHYYSDQSPNVIATVIQSIKIEDNVKIYGLMNDLDRALKKEIRELLREIQVS